MTVAKKKSRLAIIGLGAFGSLMAKHLAPHFDLVLIDAQKDVRSLAKIHGGVKGLLSDIAFCDIVIVAVPVQAMEEVFRTMKDHLAKGTLVIDVGSVKIKTARLMKKYLPKDVTAVGTHPLFGPQSAKKGIEGLKIVICNVIGRRASCVKRFCASTLGLNAYVAEPQDHDRELAYVQGLTHLIAKVVVGLNLPSFRFTTRTYDYMNQLVETVRYDSDDLFRAIERENPFTKKAKRAFFQAARKLEAKLSKGA